jgi:hypothetical protein
MVDRVSVSNLVLSKLGDEDQLTDPDDDRKAARAIKAVWDIVRDIVLRAHPWNFAMRQASLTAADPAPQFGYTHSFPLPEDFLRLDPTVMEPFSVRDAYQLEGSRRLLASTPGPVLIRYVARIEAVGDWDPLFIEAFACRLAYQICDRITGDMNRKAECWRAYTLSMGEAKGVDGRENPPEAPIDSSWVTARYDGGLGSNGYPTRFR